MKALVRLRKYAGMEPGYEPLTKLCEDRMRERLHAPGLLGPYKGLVERNLSNSDTHASAIAKLFDKYHIAGYEPAYRKLREQLTEFNEFVRRELLPRTLWNKSEWTWRRRGSPLWHAPVSMKSRTK
jgi:hypothetical protein